ncbi:MAG: ABC transporter permease [Patescibacteria group bacterium]
MSIKDLLRTAFLGLLHAKTRSLLTILGIVIGIASVILLMSIGKSAEKLILDQVQGVGSNLVFIFPGATKGSRLSSPPSVQGIITKTLVEGDIKELRKEPSIVRISPQVMGQARLVYGNNDLNASYAGVSADYFLIRGFTLASGRGFAESEVLSSSRVAVIGAELAKTLFGEESPINKSVRIKNSSFRVIGVLGPEGIGPFGVDQDNIAIIPITVAQSQLLGVEHYDVILLQANSEYQTDFVRSRITSVLRHTHHVSDPSKDDFTIRAQEELLSLLSSITSILTIFLTSIACISLVVGGIGIMNIMLVSVIERTREIGLRKALGATNRDILKQFLLESVILTFVGGVVGIAIGSLLVVLVYLILANFSASGWAFALPLSAVGIAALVSAGVGVVFGIYPASEASKKSPMEALRYE